jgi:hypothetical protein
LGVNDKQLGDGVLEAAAVFGGGTDSVDPLRRNRFDVFLTVDHECECVERMSGPFGTMAGWFSATPMGQNQGAGESIVGNVEARQESALAALQGCGLGAYRRVRTGHLIVILQSDI